MKNVKTFEQFNHNIDAAILDEGLKDFLKGMFNNIKNALIGDKLKKAKELIESNPEAMKIIQQGVEQNKAKLAEELKPLASTQNLENVINNKADAILATTEASGDVIAKVLNMLGITAIGGGSLTAIAVAVAGLFTGSMAPIFIAIIVAGLVLGLVAPMFKTGASTIVKAPNYGK